MTLWPLFRLRLQIPYGTQATALHTHAHTRARAHTHTHNLIKGLDPHTAAFKLTLVIQRYGDADERRVTVHLMCVCVCVCVCVCF